MIQRFSARNALTSLRMALSLAIAALLAIAPIADASPAEPPRRVADFATMPKPVLLPDGRLVALFLDHEGAGLPEIPREQSVVARESHDGGATWSEPRTLLALPTDEGGFGYFVPLVALDGEVHLFILCDAHTGAIRPNPDRTPAVQPLARQRLDVWHVRSRDGFTTWSEPRCIWTGRAADPMSATQLRDGRIIFPLSYFVPRTWAERGEDADTYTYTGQFDTGFLLSDDDGETWHTSPSVFRTPTPDLSSYGGVEPVVIEHLDGRVWMLIRTQMGRFYESHSNDRGDTWSPFVPSPITSSDSPAGLLRMPDDRLVLLWNNNRRHPYAQGSRQVLHAAVSEDDGRTWRGGREILRDPARNQPPPPGGDHGVSYPFLTTTPDGRGVLYSLWVQTGNRRTLEHFDPAWLLETTQRDDFASGLGAWSVFGTRGVAATAHADAEDGHTLHLGPQVPHWPTAAVWNFPAGATGELKLRAFLDADFAGSLLLTDHFSPPFDAVDRFDAPLHLAVAAGGEMAGGTRLPIGRWFDLALRWDNRATEADVLVDGEVIATVPARRWFSAISYLRLWNRSAGNLWIDTAETIIGNEPFLWEPSP